MIFVERHNPRGKICIRFRKHNKKQLSGTDSDTVFNKWKCTDSTRILFIATVTTVEEYKKHDQDVGDKRESKIITEKMVINTNLWCWQQNNQKGWWWLQVQKWHLYWGSVWCLINISDDWEVSLTMGKCYWCWRSISDVEVSVIYIQNVWVMFRGVEYVGECRLCWESVNDVGLMLTMLRDSGSGG